MIFENNVNFPIRTNKAQTTINNPIVGTKDIISDMKIYPNPVKDILTFETKDAISKVEIYRCDLRVSVQYSEADLKSILEK